MKKKKNILLDRQYHINEIGGNCLRNWWIKLDNTVEIKVEK